MVGKGVGQREERANLQPAKADRMPPGIPNPVDIHVGSRVRLRRTLLGLSQEKLGEAVGLTFQQIQKYERGANRIGASRLFEFSRILDVPVSFFFDDMAERAKVGEGQEIGGACRSAAGAARAGSADPARDLGTCPGVLSDRRSSGAQAAIRTGEVPRHLGRRRLIAGPPVERSPIGVLNETP